MQSPQEIPLVASQWSASLILVGFPLPGTSHTGEACIVTNDGRIKSCACSRLGN